MLIGQTLSLLASYPDFPRVSNLRPVLCNGFCLPNTNNTTNEALKLDIFSTLGHLSTNECNPGYF